MLTGHVGDMSGVTRSNENAPIYNFETKYQSRTACTPGNSIHTTEIKDVQGNNMSSYGAGTGKEDLVPHQHRQLPLLSDCCLSQGFDDQVIHIVVRAHITFAQVPDCFSSGNTC